MLGAWLAGALALRPAAKARAADAARAAIEAVAVVGNGAEAAGVEGVGGVAIALVVVLPVALFVALALAATLLVVLDAMLVLGSGVLAVTVVVAVIAAGSCAMGAGAGLRVNQNAAAPMATTTVPIKAQGLEDLVFLSDGGNCAGAVSSGMGNMAPFVSACLSKLRSALLPKAPGSVMGNCVGENCVLGPYSESL